MSRVTALLSAAAITTLIAMPALAAKPPHPTHPTHPTHPSHPPHPTKGYHTAPGPVAGIGLPILAAMGGYVFYMRRRQRQTSGPGE